MACARRSASAVFDNMPILHEALESLIGSNPIGGIASYSFHLARSLFQEHEQWEQLGRILLDEGWAIVKDIFLTVPENIAVLGDIAQVYVFFGNRDSVQFTIQR